MGRPLVTELLLVFEPHPTARDFAAVVHAITQHYPDLTWEDAFHTRDDGRIELHTPKR
jgi:hypothetical protein